MKKKTLVAAAAVLGTIVTVIAGGNTIIKKIDRSKEDKVNKIING